MTKIQKWGNSLAVRIPAKLAERLNVAEGTPVELAAEDNTLVVRPQSRKKYRLKDLLKDCRPSQLHGEVDWGADVGREVID